MSLTEQERRAAILALPQAQGRMAVAEVLAKSGEVTVEQAKAVLAASPKGTNPACLRECVDQLNRARMLGSGPQRPATAGR